MAEAEKKKERILVVGGITDESQIDDLAYEIMDKMFPELKPTEEYLKKRAEHKAAKAGQVKK